MKPKNFPDRKNKRRLIALSHLGSKFSRKAINIDPPIPTKERIKSLQEEEQSLQTTINPHGLRHVRTKVNRGTI